MTAPEREALVKALLDDVYLHGGPGVINANAREMLNQVAARIEALAAPAVTVTEEMVEQIKTLASAASSAEWHERRTEAKMHWRAFDEKLDAIKAALKSTTPQTGSQQ